METKDILKEQFDVLWGAYLDRMMPFFKDPANERVEPFKIADSLYYVGDKRVCIHLIDTDDGLVLIDSGYFGAEYLLIESIWRAGFDPKDVKWIIHTHGHYDHFGASKLFKTMYGTKLAISKVDAQALREKPSRAHITEELFPFATIPEFDYEIEDGEILKFGNVNIRCVLTPGHTQGVISLFFDVSYGGKTYLAGLYGGAGTNAITLSYASYNDHPLDCDRQMLSSVEKVWGEAVSIHLGNHPANNHTLEKREKQLREGGNPFISSNDWREFLTNLKTETEGIIKSNDKLRKELGI